MKPTGYSTYHWINTIAAAGLVLLASGTAIAAGQAVAVADHKDGDPQVMIIKLEKRDGADASIPAPKCESGTQETSSTTETVDKDGKKRVSRVVMCRKGGGPVDKASLAQHLEEARARIKDNAELSEDTRAKVLAALDAEIAKAKESL